MAKLRAMPDRVLVHNMKKGERKIGRIVLRDDDGKDEGIRPRWAQVYSVGRDITDVKPGQWILIEHGRWTRALEFKDPDTEETIKLWQVDYPDNVHLVSDEEPTDETWNAEIN